MPNLIHAYGSHKKKREFAESVVNWYCTKRLSRFKNLDIIIDFVKLDAEYAGFCVKLDKNNFVIELDYKMNTNDICLTICHEMTHVKQFIRQELEYTDHSVIWKSRKYTTEDYLSQPWEKEAIKEEAILSKMFFSEHPQKIYKIKT